MALGRIAITEAQSLDSEGILPTSRKEMHYYRPMLDVNVLRRLWQHGESPFRPLNAGRAANMTTEDDEKKTARKRSGSRELTPVGRSRSCNWWTSRRPVRGNVLGSHEVLCYFVVG